MVQESMSENEEEEEGEEEERGGGEKEEEEEGGGAAGRGGEGGGKGRDRETEMRLPSFYLRLYQPYLIISQLKHSKTCFYDYKV